MDIVAASVLPTSQCRGFSLKLILIMVTVLPAWFSETAMAQTGNVRTEELIITATRLPRTIENIAGTVTVISAEAMEYELVEDLNDIVRYQPGLALDSANRGGNLGFRIRGIGGNRVLTVIDGIRSSDIYAAGPSAYGKDSFDTDNLKSIEIVRGPASVLYGADAMGGAVLVNSKSPRDITNGSDGSYLKLRSSIADADNQSKLGFTGAYQSGNIGTILDYTHREFEQQSVNGPGSLNPQDGESDALQLKTVLEFSADKTLTLSFGAYTEAIKTTLKSDLSTSVSSSIAQDETDRLAFGVGYRWNSNRLIADDIQLALNYQLTEALQNTVQTRTSYSFLNAADPSTYSGTLAIRNTDFGFNQETAALNLNLWKNFEIASISHAIAYGLNFDETATERPRNRCDQEISTGVESCQISAYPFAPSENFPNKTFPDSNTKRFGIYLQDEIIIANTGLTVIPGYRYDRYQMSASLDGLVDAGALIEGFGDFDISDIDEGASSLSLGVIYDVSDRISVFSQYAEGYRPPNFDEANQAFVNLGYGYATIPNPQLEAESSRGVELGVRATLDNAFISVVTFQNRYSNFIESTFVGQQDGISLFQDRNIAAVEIQGAEVSSNWYVSNQWQVRASMAYIKGDNKTANTPLDSVDPLTAVVGLRYDSSHRKWGGELIVTAVDKKDSLSSSELATANSYTTTDLIAFYKINDSAMFRLGLFNMFDQEYSRWTSLSGLPASNTVAIENSVQPGFNFRLGFSYEL
ncbi:MAG: hypothetical protein COC19_04170 [SAR86 cluster bacterium]|uniref:TonB-dependent receptor n=1 Tax=SAR86 cluster bacterium TaxID=2030880 RepID=A0A2A4MPY0_9GAMM|nr:MAG: hypothetical protein COC19_04170 [SAR86 cluster bacterium]